MISKKKAVRPKQLSMMKRGKTAYGGDLLTKRAARRGARPLSTRETMHLVLRSTKAKGAWSFLESKNDRLVRAILAKFALKYGVRILSIGNSGNHLHLQMKLSTRLTYRAFIRAVTGAIAMAVTGRNRWSVAAANDGTTSYTKFWNRRPFTRIVQSFKGYMKVRDYVRINQLEGEGHSRDRARAMIEIENKLARERW